MIRETGAKTQVRAQQDSNELDAEARRERVEAFQVAWDDMVAAVAALSPEDQERFEREMRDAISGGIQRRVVWLGASATAEQTVPARSVRRPGAGNVAQ